MIHKAVELFSTTVLRSREITCTSAVTVSLCFLELFHRLLSAQKHKRNPFQVWDSKLGLESSNSEKCCFPQQSASISPRITSKSVFFKSLINSCTHLHAHNWHLQGFPSDCKAGDLLQKLPSPWLVSRSSLHTSSLSENKSLCFRSTCPRMCFPELFLAAVL